MPDDYECFAEAMKSVGTTAAEATERVAKAMMRMNQEMLDWNYQCLRFKVYAMPWKRNGRKRQMMKALKMTERHMKRWEVI